MTKEKQSVYNAVSNLKRSLNTFSAQVCDGFYKPDLKFVSQILFGIMTAQDVKLTNIGRALKEPLELKCTEEKPYGTDFEGLCDVRDGSTGKIEKGFPTIGLIALTDVKLPLPVYENIFSYKDDDIICRSIVKCYLMRWKIEEFYRFKKQTFNFEDIRVMSLKSINNLNFFVNLLIGFLAMKSTDAQDKPIIVTLINQVKRIYKTKNILYSVCSGIFAVFSMVAVGFESFFSSPVSLCGQILLF